MQLCICAYQFDSFRLLLYRQNFCRKEGYGTSALPRFKAD
jgi:hypothetical protein